jgi:hypothetical protein
MRWCQQSHHSKQQQSCTLETSTTNVSDLTTSLETSATNDSNLTTSLEAEVKGLAADLKKVQESCVSLEGFSRRHNLRLVSAQSQQKCLTQWISFLGC